ncbi:MAG: flagellar motor protein MotB [Oscillospiraceae bacterium]
MARKKRDSGGGYSWMDTCGDMVTLLLTFFIMLFSMSTVDENKWKVLVTAFSRTANASVQQITLVPDGEGDQVAPATGTDELNIGEPDIVNDLPIDLQQLYEYLVSYVEQNQMEGSVTIEQDAAKNVYIRFDNNIFFDGDSSALRTESYPLIEFMGKCFKAVEEQIFMVRVNGHTAEIKGSGVNDWMLSSERAVRIVTYFDEVTGISPKKLMGNGYGKNYPRATNDTAEGRAKNRRVEIMVIGNSENGQDPQMLYDIEKKLMSGAVIDDLANGVDVLKEEMGTANSGVAASKPTESTPPASKPPESNPPANSVKPVANGKLPPQGNSVKAQSAGANQ